MMRQRPRRNRSSTAEDTAVAITLTGTDPESDPLTFAVVTQPSNGTLSGVAPNLTYTPNANYNGADSFTFTASDATLTSAAATVSITVTAGNDAPMATPQSVSTSEDTAVAITLTGTDPESDPLTFAVLTQPSNGTLSGAAPNLTYTPNANYNGADSFTFTASDATLDQRAVTVSITVTAGNDAPTATTQSVSTAEDTALAITLTAPTRSRDPLTFAVVTRPSNGTLSGTAPNLTYTPNANYNGADSFTFTASDATLTSAAATVTITRDPGNDAPTATPQSVVDHGRHAGGDHADGHRPGVRPADVRGGQRAKQRHAERHRTEPDLHAERQLQRCRQFYVHRQRRLTDERSSDRVDHGHGRQRCADGDAAVGVYDRGHTGVDHADGHRPRVRPADVRGRNAAWQRHAQRRGPEPDLHPGRQLQRCRQLHVHGQSMPR